MFIKKEQKGYTMIEILVTISIIAFLTTAALFVFNTTRSKQRDTRRLSDIQTIQKALDLYHNENGSYPQEGVEQMSSNCNGSNVFSTTLQVLKTGDFISEVPKDPFWRTAQGVLPYCYIYITGSNAISNSDCTPAPPDDTSYLLMFGTESIEPDYASSIFGTWCVFK